MNNVIGIVGGVFAGPDIFRVDLVSPAGGVFSNPFLFELFEDPGAAVGASFALVPQVFGNPVGLTAFLNANAGNTLRLRIGQAESNFPWDTSVDNITLNATIIPEPSSGALLMVGLGIAIRSRRR